jgi:hypothetical protein
LIASIAPACGAFKSGMQDVFAQQWWYCAITTKGSLSVGDTHTRKMSTSHPLGLSSGPALSELRGGHRQHGPSYMPCFTSKIIGFVGNSVKSVMVIVFFWVVGSLFRRFAGFGFCVFAVWRPRDLATRRDVQVKFGGNSPRRLRKLYK